MKQKENILEDIKSILSSRDNIIFVFLFGSYLEVENPNDIDIGIFIDKEKVTEQDSFDYALGLSVELSYKLPKEIDVVVLNDAPLGLAKNIIQGTLLFSKNDTLKDEFIERITREYMDYYYYSKEFLREVLNV